jgi:hypothetical protein
MLGRQLYPFANKIAGFAKPMPRIVLLSFVLGWDGECENKLKLLFSVHPVNA